MPKRTYITSDRFIRQRLNSDQAEMVNFKLSKPYNPFEPSRDPKKRAYTDALCRVLFNESQTMLYSQPIFPTTLPARKKIKICASKDTMSIENLAILDAPNIHNDFYINSLAWSNYKLIYLTLFNEIYSYNTESKAIKLAAKLTSDVTTEYFTSINVAKSQYWHAATSNGQLWTFDINNNHILKNITLLNASKAYVIQPTQNEHILYAAGDDNQTYCYDLRIPNPLCYTLAQGQDSTLKISGLSYNDENLVATGSQSLVNIWDIRRLDHPHCSMTRHNASVKALQFHPTNTHVIASGGGNGDGSIRIWDANNGSEKVKIDTDSQVTSVLWSYSSPNHLISTHGYSSNQVALWNVTNTSNPTQVNVQKTPHTDRVLCAAKEPQSDMFATVSADESLRLWKPAFSIKPKKTESKPSIFNRSPTIR